MTGPTAVAGSAGLPRVYLPEVSTMQQRKEKGDIRLQLILYRTQELIVHIHMHINPFNGATALPGVKHRAVDNLLRGVFDIDVSADIRGILPTELEVERDYTFGSCFAQTDTPGRGADERDGVDFRNLDNIVQNLETADVGELEDVRRKAGVVEDVDEAASYEGCLRGWP